MEVNVLWFVVEKWDAVEGGWVNEVERDVSFFSGKRYNAEKLNDYFTVEKIKVECCV